MNVIDMAEEAFTALDELRHSSAENVEASETASVEDDYKAWDWAVERGLVPKGKLRDDKFREEIAAASKYELVRRIIREWAASQGASNGTAWQAVDLQALVDGGTNGIPASVLLRTDGRALLVPSALNTVFGYGGQGKSFFATMAIAQVILGGRDAAYLSYELAPEVIVDRLHNVFQVPMDLILRHLRIYYRQIGYPGGVIEGSESGIAVAVIDSTNRALVAHGFRENDVSGFGQLVLDVITPFVDSGTAVLTIDHVTQAKETRDRPINSVSKFNDVQGAMYSLETGIPFAKDKSGWAKLVLRKDNTSATDWARDDVVGYLVCEANARGEGYQRSPSNLMHPTRQTSASCPR